MATDDFSPLDRLLSRASDLPDTSAFSVDDVGRMSHEALLRNTGEDPRRGRSRGRLRLHGPAVHGHAADLTSVATIAAGWQRAVTAVAAALEGQRELRGRLRGDVVRRSRMLLSASPLPGSVVLLIEPAADAMAEVEPNGNVALFSRVRPLADRAAEELITLAAELAGEDLPDLEQAAARMRRLGPRVASALRTLAQAVEASDASLDTTWDEPERPSVHSTWTASNARWVREFVDGRDLDAEDQELIGKAITVSTADKWLVEMVHGEPTRVRVDASKLTLAQTRQVRLGDVVRLHVQVTAREQADGTVRIARQAQSVDVLPPDALQTLPTAAPSEDE